MNQRLRRSPPDVVYTPIDVTSTFAGDTATLTIDKASNLFVRAPVEGTNVLLTDTIAIHVANSGGSPTNQYGIYIDNLTSGGTNYSIYSAGGLVQVDGSIVVGSPTGGDKGAGTINATAVYDDNTLLTDFVFEPGYNMLPIPDMVAYFERKHHLPTIPGRDEWEKRGQFSVGQLGTHLWETVEVHARYIGEHEARFSTIEDRVDALKEANEILTKQLVEANLIPEV